MGVRGHGERSDLVDLFSLPGHVMCTVGLRSNEGKPGCTVGVVFIVKGAQLTFVMLQFVMFPVGIYYDKY